MKKAFYLIPVSLLCIVLISYFFLENEKAESARNAVNYKEFANMRFDFSYHEFSSIKIEELVALGEVGRFGVEGNIAKFSRGLRFKSITDAVEERYNLPSGIIFAMMIEESNGVDLLPNGLGDGGFGLCHMQPIIAKSFNLKTFKNCSALICNGRDRRSCKKGRQRLNHAKDLSDFVEKNKSDRLTLVSADDRLHPIKNLDAVGRMLAYHMDGPQIRSYGPLRTAICRYAGKYNYQQYWRDVRGHMSLLEDKSFLKKVEREFNKSNPDLLIDGKKGDWEMYLKSFEKMNENYGLSEYKKLPKYIPKNSESVKKTYRNFL